MWFHIYYIIFYYIYFSKYNGRTGDEGPCDHSKKYPDHNGWLRK